MARQYGVRAAMPGFIGKKLCPNLIIVEPNFDKYRQISAQIHEVLAIYDPHFSSVGLDEAYLDLTNFIEDKLAKSTCESSAVCKEPKNLIIKKDSTTSGNNDGSWEEHTSSQLPLTYWRCAEVVVEEIRCGIFKKTGLTASAGIAPNKMLAKVASDVNKPNGQYLVNPTQEGILQFVQKLPIRKVDQVHVDTCMYT